MSDDRDLRDAFGQLREAESRDVPRFTIPSTRPRRHPRMIGAVVAAMLVAALALVYVSQRPHAGVDTAVVTMPAWRAPTDFLLRTPGSDLTSSVPRIEPQFPKISKGDRS